MVHDNLLHIVNLVTLVMICSAIGWKLSLVVRKINCHLRYYMIRIPTEFPRFLRLYSLAANTHDDVKWKHFRITSPLRGKFNGHGVIPFTKAVDAELWCFLWSAVEQTVEQTVERPVIWDATVLIMTPLQCFFFYIMRHGANISDWI